MVKAKTVIPEREMLHCKGGNPAFLKYGIAEIGTEGQVLDSVGAMTKKAFYIANFKSKSPEQVPKHDIPGQSGS